MLRQSNAFKKEEARYLIRPKNPDEISDDYQKVLDYIASCPAMKDPKSRIKIEDNCIYFGCSLLEIKASFPKLPEMLMKYAVGYDFRERDVLEFIDRIPDLEFVVLKHIAKEQKEILNLANSYFSKMQNNEMPSLTGKLSKKELEQLNLATEQLLELFPGITVGEIHSEIAAKKFIVDNMYYFHAKNAVIFMEHLLSDTMQYAIDEYMNSDSWEMPPMLRDYLIQLDKGFRLVDSDRSKKTSWDFTEDDLNPESNAKQNPLPFQPYSFMGIIIAAKLFKIPVFAIDTAATYEARITDVQPSETIEKRCSLLNYNAATISTNKLLPNQIGILLSGRGHLLKVKNVTTPPIGNLLQWPAIVFYDVKENDPMVIKEMNGIVKINAPVPEKIDESFLSSTARKVISIYLAHIAPTLDTSKNSNKKFEFKPVSFLFHESSSTISNRNEATAKTKKAEKNSENFTKGRR